MECETAVLKAFAEVESGSRAAFWRLNRGDGAVLPAILYERHYFSRLTARRYDHTHPDLSWRVGYRTRARLGKSDRRMHDGRVDANDIYANYASSYLRLINAFRLDPDAALKSCSWGKFQIMGANHALCGEKTDVKGFVAAMAHSERAQLDLVGQFIRQTASVERREQQDARQGDIALGRGQDEELECDRIQLQRPVLQDVPLRSATQERL